MAVVMTQTSDATLPRHQTPMLAARQCWQKLPHSTANPHALSRLEARTSALPRTPGSQPSEADRALKLDEGPPKLEGAFMISTVSCRGQQVDLGVARKTFHTNFGPQVL